MKIIKVQEGDRKIGLSIKAVKSDEYQKDLQTYREASSSDRSTIGDILRAQQEAAAARDKEAEE
jgi:translation initiation factor 2 alpha subunit (eIF-2alpha)